MGGFVKFRAPVHSDERGRLLVVEHSILHYSPRRVFVVTGAQPGIHRGDHLVPCLQTMVLVSGGVDVTLRDSRDADARHERLDVPGDALNLLQGEFVTYVLDGPESTIMVLAEASYLRPNESEVLS